MLEVNSVGLNNFYSKFMSKAPKETKQAMITKNYNQIYAHELAHKSAGGNYAGAIVIERNQDGIPVGGHVSIKMPTLNKTNPQKTIDHANVVIKSAMAPVDPSGQDYKVAAQARTIKGQAQEQMGKNKTNKQQKPLNFIA